MNLKIISAGAGSGKTYRLTKELVELLASGNVRASGIIATTFTNKAAAELQERVRVRLLEEGLTQAANDLSNALIGTVHGLGVKLLKRFAYEAGVSPHVDIIADEDQQMLFNQSLSMVLTNERVEEMELLSDKLGLTKSDFGKTDWRKLLKDLAEVVRANDFGDEVLEVSKQRSFESFARFLDPAIERLEAAWNTQLNEELDTTISRLENNGDATKVTADGVKSLREIKAELRLRGNLYWHQWAKIAKTKVGAKSRDDMEDLVGFANTHLGHAGLRNDVKSFIFNIFELAAAAMDEFERFKKSRGLIDYNDMESYVKRLLDDPTVQEVLAEELDLLLVDEFQDTNPLQLEIFVKLSRFARHSIWVGDPKQSIYGFRGADPALMQAIIEGQGGLQTENILSHSWRSREDVVFATNAIFTKAFSKLPAEQVALQPVRCKKAADSGGFSKTDEPAEMGNALIHWHFNYDGEGRKPGKEWLQHCIAETLRKNLERGLTILPKGEKTYRLAKPGDVAILCRSNTECRDMAGALHRAGLRAAISRAGLMATAEAKLILACLKFILNKYDSLSVAEILLLAARLELHQIVEDRLAYLEAPEDAKPNHKWGEQYDFVKQLNDLRPQVAELSGSEILTLLLEELDLRRIIITWGNVEQRLANVDMLIHFSLQYEQACNRLNSAASLGGFLLWANDLAQNENDLQGSGENPLAVNVLTYHKSKGLEYPIVICNSMEQALREDVWGISLVPETETVDLNNLLGNRWLRLWVNPYADQFKSTLLDERMSESPEKQEKRTAALAEEIRLMYVGLTRARDYLVFPTREKPPLWLNRVCNSGQEEQPALDANSNESYWEWAGKTLMMDKEVNYYPNDFQHTDIPEMTGTQLAARRGRGDFKLYIADSGSDKGNGLSILSQSNCYSPFELPELPERLKVAQAFKSYLLASCQNDSVELEQAIAEQLIERHDVAVFVDSVSFKDKYKLFKDWLFSQFPIKKVNGCYPVRRFVEGQLFEGEIDLMLETEHGAIIIQLTKFIGDTKNRQRKLRSMEDELKQFKHVLEMSMRKAGVRVFVIFLLYGEVLEVGV